jgi:hypothetical protein
MQFTLAVAEPDSRAAKNSRWNLAVAAMKDADWSEAVQRLEDVVKHSPEDGAAREALTCGRFLAPIQRFLGLMVAPPAPFPPDRNASSAKRREYEEDVKRQQQGLVRLPGGDREMLRQNVRPAFTELRRAAEALQPVRELVAGNDPQGAMDLKGVAESIVQGEAAIRDGVALLTEVGASAKILKPAEAQRLGREIDDLLRSR